MTCWRNTATPGQRPARRRWWRFRLILAALGPIYAANWEPARSGPWTGRELIASLAVAKVIDIRPVAWTPHAWRGESLNFRLCPRHLIAFRPTGPSVRSSVRRSLLA